MKLIGHSNLLFSHFKDKITEDPSSFKVCVKVQSVGPQFSPSLSCFTSCQYMSPSQDTSQWRLRLSPSAVLRLYKPSCGQAAPGGLLNPGEQSQLWLLR